jgi:hypothetical protein
MDQFKILNHISRGERRVATRLLQEYAYKSDIGLANAQSEMWKAVHHGYLFIASDFLIERLK